jgi:hypothetical protein
MLMIKDQPNLDQGLNQILKFENHLRSKKIKLD